MKNLKRFVAVTLANSLFITLSAPSFAQSPDTAYSSESFGEVSYVELSDEQLIQQMHTMGFSQAEIDAILSLEHERVEANKELNVANARRSFPSNPKEGDWHYETISIHLSTISMTTFGVIGALIKGGVGAGIAITIAGAIVNEWKEDSGYEILEVTISYRYGTTNDGVLGWTPGPVEWRLI